MKAGIRTFVTRTLVAGLVTAAVATASQAQTLKYVTTVDAPTGVAEIVTYDPATNQVFTTSGSAVDVYDFGTGDNIAASFSIDLSGLFGGDLDGISSVAIDPLGRGFGAALAIPKANTTSLGLVVFFDTTTGAVLNTIAVGYNPDMITFTDDGASALIANEGEASTDTDEPLDPEGSISIVDLDGGGIGDIANLTTADVSTYNFAPANLANPSDLQGLRIDPRNRFNIPADLEPEYISVSNGLAYVALQENSAIAVFDLAARQWVAIHNIDGKEQVIDASDKDGIKIDDKLFGLFMPDAIATYEVDGVTYIVTANEGDARDGVEGEEQRVKDLVKGPTWWERILNRWRPSRFPLPEIPEGAAVVDPCTFYKLNRMYEGDFQAKKALGRIRVTTIDGDQDGDGDIDRLTVYGTRSFSIFNGETGALVFDSGSDFETITANLVPALFNGEENDPDEFDGRSDNKGPEPEGVAVTSFEGSTLAAIGLERVGGVMLYDVTDPANSAFLQYVNSFADEGVDSDSPEGLVWVSAGGKTFLVISYEESGTVDVYELTSPAPADEEGGVVLGG